MGLYLKRRVRYPTLAFVSFAVDKLREAYPEDSIQVMNIGAVEASISITKSIGDDIRRFRDVIAYKGASLIYFLIRNHPLVDGNKRFAMYMTGFFFRINGCKVNRRDLTEAILKVALGSMERKRVYELLKESIKKVNRATDLINKKNVAETVFKELRPHLNFLRDYDIGKVSLKDLRRLPS
jgi:hypothetical protein